MKWSWLLAVALACTRPNPAVCCLDEADCDKAGLSEVRACATGLACVEHECVVPSCSTNGCEASAPVCNITVDVCERCADSSDCSRFARTDVCDANSGACVECVGDADCDAAQPVCDANTCRVCKRDSECLSSACGDDGACVEQSAIVYLDPNGTDAGACTRAVPCRTLMYAVTRTSELRSHFVFAPGDYVDNANFDAQTTTASHLYFHGGGAKITSGSFENNVLKLHLPCTIRDLTLSGPQSNAALNLYAGPYVVERVSISDANMGIAVGTAVEVRDVTIDSPPGGYGIWVSSGQLTVDRAVLRGGTNGIRVNQGGGVTTNLTNLLVWGTTGLALDLQYALGTLNFSTIVDSGSDSGTGPRAVMCSQLLTVRSSIIWAPGSVERVPSQGCNFVTSIAGPTATPGAMNTDPLFADAANHDYRIRSNSPARDAVDNGPSTDFEGDARPRGARFDIGADEAP